MPAARTATSTWPGPGSGRATSRTSRTSTPPYSSNWTALGTSLSRDAFGAGETRRQELPGPVQCSGRFVEDRGVALEDVRHPRGDLERDLDVGDGGLPREAEGVVEEDLVASGLDDQGRKAGQVGEYGADQVKRGVLSLRVVLDPGLQELPVEQRVDVALALHGRPGQGEIDVR